MSLEKIKLFDYKYYITKKDTNTNYLFDAINLYILNNSKNIEYNNGILDLHKNISDIIVNKNHTKLNILNDLYIINIPELLDIWVKLTNNIFISKEVPNQNTVIYILKCNEINSKEIITEFINKIYNEYKLYIKKLEETINVKYFYILHNVHSFRLDMNNFNYSYEYSRFILKNNKCFDNLFFPEKKQVIKLLDDFINKTNKFNIKGISHKLGFLLHGIAGSGKCLGFNTEILMLNGNIKKVQDIRIGDLLMGIDSKPRKVLTLGKGKDEMYEISNIKGDKYIVNSEHILCLKNIYSLHIIDIEIKKAYYIKWFNTKSYELQLKKFSYENENKINIYEEAKKFKDRLNKNKEVIISVKEYLNLSKQIKKQLNGYKTDYIKFKEIEVKLDPYLYGLWLSEETNNNNNIPYIYKINSKENRLKLLAGIIDIDGYLYNNSYEIIQNNDILSKDIVFIARSLGYVCYNKKHIYKEYKYNKMIISGNNLKDIPVLCKDKMVKKCKPIKNQLITKISIKSLGKGNYYGFELDGDHKFILGNFIVTHNTSLIKAISNYTNRHIISIPLSKIKTNGQLLDVMIKFKMQLKDEITDRLVKDDTITDFSQAIFIMEDIDCANNVVHSRKEKYENSDKEDDDDDNDNQVNDKLNLDGLLNILDGIIDTPNRIIIMTTNYPEKLDYALIRPGRINKKILLTYMKENEIFEMISYYFNSKLTSNNKKKLIEKLPKKIVPAYMEQLCIENDSFKDLMNSL